MRAEKRHSQKSHPKRWYLSRSSFHRVLRCAGIVWQGLAKIGMIFRCFEAKIRDNFMEFPPGGQMPSTSLTDAEGLSKQRVELILGAGKEFRGQDQNKVVAAVPDKLHHGIVLEVDAGKEMVLKTQL